MTPSIAPQVQASLQRLRDALQRQRRMIDRQLAALAQAEAQPGDASTSPALMLVLYLGMPSAKAVAELCNAQGLRMPGAKGPRRCDPGDVYSLVRNGAPDLCPELLAMARCKLDGAAGGTGESRFG